MNLTSVKIKQAIGIDHPMVNDFIGNNFTSDEEVLQAVKDNHYEIVNHCDKSDVGDIYDNIKKGNYKAYPLENDTYDVLIAMNSEYYLIELTKANEVK